MVARSPPTSVSSGATRGWSCARPGSGASSSCPSTSEPLEGLRRVSEGKPGATWCRECGEVFLTLDARRSTFCTDRERMRFAQRARARAIAASTP